MQNKVKGYLQDILYDIIGALIQGIGIYCFIVPADIAPGGASGLAILINRFVSIPIGILMLAINIPLLLMAYFSLGKKFTLKTLKTIIITTIALDFIISPTLPQYTGDRLIASIFGGVCVGAALALIFRRGSTTGGSDIAGYLLKKRYPHFPIGYAMGLIDFCIIGLSILVFKNIESGLYGLITMFCTNQVIDMILYGEDKGTMVMVLSSKTEEMAEAILCKARRGATFLKSRGAYGKEERETLLCVMQRREFHQVKHIIDEIDPNAFIIVSETKEVYGEGFKLLLEDK
ncbi:membrane protein [Clostridia bacterium]|nr:membrane protein [Clostridia bacterium]